MGRYERGWGEKAIPTLWWLLLAFRLPLVGWYRRWGHSRILLRMLEKKNDILVDELMMEIHDIHDMRRWGGLGSTGWRLVVCWRMISRTYAIHFLVSVFLFSFFLLFFLFLNCHTSLAFLGLEYTTKVLIIIFLVVSFCTFSSPLPSNSYAHSQYFLRPLDVFPIYRPRWRINLLTSTFSPFLHTSKGKFYLPEVLFYLLYIRTPALIYFTGSLSHSPIAWRLRLF